MNKKFQQLKSWINAYLNNHLRAFKESWHKLKNEKIANLLTTSIITLTLTIPVIFYLCILNIQTLTTTWQTNSSQISLYLKPSLSENKIQNFLTNLRNNPSFTAIKYISPHEGLQNFAQTLENSKIITVLKNNPLPPLIVIQPKILN